MGSAKPLVSVLTPSYNQARWLADNLRSVASQTYPNIEQIVMDGGSTDGTIALLEKADPRVRWRSDPDKGQPDALNKAFAESRGEIIGWINSDDALFDRRTIEIVADYFESHPDVDMVYGHVAYVNADGLVLHIIWSPPYWEPWFKLYNTVAQPAAFIRRSAVRGRLVDPDLHFAMDYELFLRLARVRRPVRINRVLAIDRVQPGRKSVTQLPMMYADFESLRAEYGLIRQSTWSLRLQRAIGVFSRFMGARFVGAIDQDLAFDAQPTTKMQLLKRQIATRRRHMPVQGGD